MAAYLRNVIFNHALISAKVSISEPSFEVKGKLETGVLRNPNSPRLHFAVSRGVFPCITAFPDRQTERESPVNGGVSNG